MPHWLGWPELVVILVIVLVIFGAGRVPEIARSLGKGIREFKGSMTEKEEPQAEAEKPADTAKKS